VSLSGNLTNNVRGRFGGARGKENTPLKLNILRLGRFTIVGLAATFVYFAITAALGRPPIKMNPIVANAFGVATSLSVSYLGHHRYTFNAVGKHERYLPRFLIVTACLFILSTVVMTVARYVWFVDFTVVTACISIGYPLASYVLNMLWTFSHENAHFRCDK
jgi:putative flippase GtrA